MIGSTEITVESKFAEVGTMAELLASVALESWISGFEIFILDFEVEKGCLCGDGGF